MTLKTSTIKIPEKIKEQLIKKQYGIVGNHSAVQICSWSKKALKNEGVCYKEIFYDIDCHRCAQMTPAVVWCQNNCIYCWRPMEFMKALEMDPDEVDDPDLIIKETIKVRWQLLSGIKASPKINMKKYEEARIPNHWAISLSGEPTIYPKLDELIKKLKERPEVKSVFLVTNGQRPDVLKKLAEKDALPVQLYISVSAPNKDVFKKVVRPVYKDGWERLNKSLELLRELKVRRVFRLTIIKGWNDADEYFPQYAELVRKSQSDFVEIKAYMFLGYSTHRLRYSNMPTHEEIKEYAKKLLQYLPEYKYENEAPRSRIVLLKNKNSIYPDKIDYSWKNKEAVNN